MGHVWVRRTHRIVDDVVDFGGDKTDDDEDRDNGKGIGSYRNVSEKLCGCTLLARSCILTLTQKRIHLTLTTVAVFVILIYV